MRRLPLALLVVVAVLVPGAARAAPAEKRLWATINVCATGDDPNVVGVRASMPGNGTRQRLYMRFEAQWYSARKERYVYAGSRSPWIHVGSARLASTQDGYSFDFRDPSAGKRFKLRGLVRYQWRELRRVGESKRRREVVVKRDARVTRSGVRGVEGGRPPGRSDAVCVVEGAEGSY